MIVEREESAPATASTASATTSTSGTSDVSQYPVHSLPIGGCVYRGEGNANLVVALPSERKVIRLRKSLVGSTSLAEDARRVRREVDFIRGIISAFLGCYVCVPEILRCDQAEIARLSEKIRAARPENRRSKNIVGGFATKFPDYMFLPENLSSFSSKSTFCLEIKPKQGFLCNADRQFPKCPYCLTQYYKTRNGSVKEQSVYCPFDLFSGQAERMNRALLGLLRSPQNNLKIFKDGVVVYDADMNGEERLGHLLNEWFPGASHRSIEAFLELVRVALTRSFFVDDDDGWTEKPLQRLRDSEIAVLEVLPLLDLPSRLDLKIADRAKFLLGLLAEECELSEEKLARGSVLERIQRIQSLHRCGADAVAWIYAKLSETMTSTSLNDELIYADLLELADFTPEAVQPETATDLNEVKHKRKKLRDWMDMDGTSEHKSNAISRLYEKNNNVSKQKDQTAYNEIIEENFLKNITIDDCYNVLRNYLLFCTAKDCSISIAFQEVDNEILAKISSEHVISLSKNNNFLVSVRVLDLDMKSLQSIEKHRRRDNDVLQATRNELEKKLAI